MGRSSRRAGITNLCRIVVAGTMFWPLAGAAAAADLARGRATYNSICASCHGVDGRASLMYAPSFVRGEMLDKDDKALIVSVRDGVFRMPPWGGVLSDGEIADAIAYARTLRRNLPTPKAK